MYCPGTSYVGHADDDLGSICHVFCDACRTIAVDASGGVRRRRSWRITYLDPAIL